MGRARPERRLKMANISESCRRSWNCQRRQELALVGCDVFEFPRY